MARLQVIHLTKYQAIEIASMALFKTYVSHSLNLFIQIGHLKGKLHISKEDSTQNFI